MNRPIAAMTERKTIVRATVSRGVAVVSEVDGITNRGAGPGFGPTANVKAPRMGWPSAETTRQNTRYHPCGTRRNGTTSVSVFPDRFGGPIVSRLPLASVTETIAKRGSTASVYVSETRAGGLLTTTLAAGDVRSSAACAEAAAGSASATAAVAMPAQAVRPRGVRPAGLRSGASSVPKADDDLAVRRGRLLAPGIRDSREPLANTREASLARHVVDVARATDRATMARSA